MWLASSSGRKTNQTDCLGRHKDNSHKSTQAWKKGLNFSWWRIWVANNSWQIPSAKGNLVLLTSRDQEGKGKVCRETHKNLMEPNVTKKKWNFHVSQATCLKIMCLMLFSHPPALPPESERAGTSLTHVRCNVPSVLTSLYPQSYINQMIQCSLKSSLKRLTTMRSTFLFLPQHWPLFLVFMPM